MFPSPQLTRNELAVCCFLSSKELRSSIRIEKHKKAFNILVSVVKKSQKVFKELGEAFAKTREVINALSSMR